MKLGSYTLHEELGRGTFGAVHRATRPDGSEVAVKVLLAPGPDALARFERERRLLATLGEAAGFVPLLDAGEEAGRPFLVMPLLVGGTLAARIAKRPLPVPEAVALGAHLARALGAAHAVGVVHRDLKPQNVLHDASGRALIADLGLARHFRRDADGDASLGSLTAAGIAAGTLGYMAPEQLDDARQAGPQADVFSLGAILFECLAGRRAFVADGPLSYARAIEAGAPRVDSIRTGVPAPLAALVARSLEKDPARRPRDGAAFARELESLGAKEPARAPRRRAGLTLLAVGLLVAGGVALARPRAPVSVPAPRPPVPAPRPVTPPSDPEPDIRESIAAYKSGAMGPSLAAAERALRKDPRSPSALAARALARAALNELDLARADSRRAIDLGPGVPFAQAISAIVRSMDREYADALAAADKALALDDRDSFSWYARAFVHEQMVEVLGLEKRSPEAAAARADFTEAIRRDERFALAYYMRSYIADSRAKSLADCEKVIELVPGFAPAFINRGADRLTRGDARGALVDLDRAIELDPDHPIGRLCHAQALLGGERGSEPATLRMALADLDHAIVKAPSYADAYRVRAIVRRGLGDAAGAAQDEERCQHEMKIRQEQRESAR